jgi:hypothetical protein
MTALQQLIAAGYVTLILIGIESLVIWWITTYHVTGKRWVRDGLSASTHALLARMWSPEAFDDPLICLAPVVFADSYI